MSYEDTSLEWSELVPGGVIVYYADGAEEILHANKYVLDLCECRDFDEFLELTGGTFRGFVKASDIDAAEDSIWGQVSKRGGLDHVYHQIRTRSNKIVSVDDYGRLVRSEGRRPVFYVFLVEMERHSVIDWLTGLPGMERFDYLAGIEAGMIERRGKTPVLLLLDIMGMKSYNALHGRDEGNRLICRLATAMRHAFGSDLCCRIAGDSFCSIAPADEMEARAKAVFDEFANSEGIEAPPVMAGACAFQANDSIEIVLDKARLACELDHSTKESHLTWFTEKMRNETLLRAHVLESLDQAIAQGWISPYYQGIVRTSTGRLCCVEVLSRWFDPQFGTLLPGMFIPYLEEDDLIRKIDLHLVTCVAKDIASRLRSGLPVVPASINISIGHQYDPSIARQIAARVDAEGVSRSMFRFEVAESIVSSNPDILKARVDDLHNEGFEVWLDNFGSGLSSFNLLKEMDFDLIKLDMSFLMEGSEQKRSTMIEGVIHAAKSLGVKTLAEGVETYVLAQEMASMGCDMLQGFSFSVPSLSVDFEFGGKNSMGQEPEPLDEITYWDKVGLVSLKDLAVGSKIRTQGFDSSLLPAGVIERRDGKWYILRATEPLIKIMQTNNAISRNLDIMHFARQPVVLDEAFYDAVERCEATQSWERVDGPMEYGTGFLISVKPLTQCARAHAFLLGSTPSPLGSALGTYGDVPVGYAVFSMVQNSDGRTIDATYVYANERYRRWGGIEGPSLVGRSVLDASPGEGEYWLALLASVAKTGENLHDVVYSPKAFHWLSYSVTPSLVENHCILAYTIADAEQRERQELIDAGTHDALTGLLNRRGIDSEIQRRTSEGLGQGMVIILLDLDDFKAINDLHGHDAGDEALRSIAIDLLEVFPHTAVVGRNGGDEFLVALFDADANAAQQYLDELMALDRVFSVRGNTYSFSVSVGFARMEPGDELRHIYTKADEALYAVKMEGKAGYREWSPSCVTKTQRSRLGFSTRDVVQGMPLAMVVHEPNGEIQFANDEVARLLGYDSVSNAISLAGHSLQGLVHPDDWALVQSAIERMAGSENASNEAEAVVRVYARDGSFMWVRYAGRFVSSDHRGDMVYAYMVRSAANGDAYAV